MNRRELIKTLADKLSITRVEAMRFAQAWEEVTTEALENDGSLMLLGFGTFSAWEQTERIGRNPKNGVAYMIRARKSVKFKPGKLFTLLSFNRDTKVVII